MASSIDPRDIDISKLRERGSSLATIEVPFELTAKDFLDFASEDLKGKSMIDTVNALGNIKRSIDCLFDSLLFAVNFLEDSKRERWTFPEKMNFLSEIGIITPYILSRINSARNLLEHEFKKPVRKDVEMAYDVAILLYYATVRFTRGVINQLGLTTEDETWRLGIDLNIEDRKIELSRDGEEFFVTWDEKPEDYKRWLYIIYRRWYLTL